MRKILALTRNEWIKISRRTSLLVLLILMILAMTGLGVIMKVTLNTSYGGSVEDPEWAEGAMQDTLEHFRNELASLKAQMDTADEERLPALEQEADRMEREIRMYERAIELDISLVSGVSYLADLLRERGMLEEEAATLEQIPETDRTEAEQERLARLTDRIGRYDTILEQRDFADYIALRNEDIRSDPTLSDEEKQIRTDINALRLELDPEGHDADGTKPTGVSNALGQIETLRRSLAVNIDYGRYSDAGMTLPLTPERRVEVENELAVVLYRLEHGISDTSQEQNMADMAATTLIGVGLFLSFLIMTVLAGSAISTEISTGSIRSLIIAPVRRWKIFVAKMLSLWTAGLALAFLLYAVAMLLHTILFGAGAGSPYVYAVNGQASEIGFYLYRLARVGVQFIDVMVYAMFALLLSTVTRNTAVSVGLSIAVYFSSGIIRAFLSLWSDRDWIRFLPFSNLNLVDRFFPFDEAGSSLFGLGQGMQHPSTLTFSLLYLGALLLCMGYTALDSFSRRDIG